MTDEHDHQPVPGSDRMPISLCRICNERIVPDLVTNRWTLFRPPATEVVERIEIRQDWHNEQRSDEPALLEDGEGRLLVDWRAINVAAARRKITKMVDDEGNVLVPWDPHGLDMAGVQERSMVWRLRRFPETSTLPTVALKACEEVGEVARAVIGVLEEREGRGDVVLEAAQAIIVLASLVADFNLETGGDRNVFAVALGELDRLGA